MAIAPSKSGFLLLDMSLNLIASNPEAVRILSYPSNPDRIKNLKLFVSERLRSGLHDYLSTDYSNDARQYESGRRKYNCRKFQVNYEMKPSSQPAVVLLLERNASNDLGLEEICRQFNLTPRERATVELLVHGLTTKEIADRLSISPNTVKAFVRLVMVKMGVSTRTGVVGRLTASRIAT